MAFLAGNKTDMTYEEAQRKRALAEALLGQSIQTVPKTYGEAYTAIGQALAGRIAGKKADKADRAGKAEADGLWSKVWGGALGGQQGGGQAAQSGGVAPAGGQYAMKTDNPAGLPQGIVDAVDRVNPQYDPFSVIKGFEGFRETPYWDVNALRTGYGSDTVTLPDGSVQKVGEGTRVTREDADRDLKRRVETEFAPIAARAVGADVFSSLPQEQQAALTSIAYNYGELPSSVAKAVQTPGIDDDLAAIRALGSHNGGVNAARRAKEAEIYAAGAGQPGGNLTMSAAGGDPMAGNAMQPTPAQADPLAGLDPALLMEAIANPYMSEQQKSVIGTLLQQRLAPPDPMADIELQKAQLELQQMQNPGQQLPPDVQERMMLAEMGGLQPGTPEYQQFILNGKMANAPGDGTEYGLQPVYGTDKDGNTIIMQIGKDGTAVTTKLPDGVTPDLAVKAYETSRGGAEGKAAGEDAALYDSTSSKMPGLEAVVGELGNVANDATYTWAGQLRDAVSAQLGFDPGEGAKARTKYIAMVDNQVLPMLRDTFGAAFTVKEGETLRATLGDPNKTPAEKQEVLQAFIEQKRRDLSALGNRTGEGGGSGLSADDLKYLGVE